MVIGNFFTTQEIFPWKVYLKMDMSPVSGLVITMEGS